MNPDINIDKAIESANPKLVLASVSLPEKIPEILLKNDLKLRTQDQQTIAETLSDVLLGIMPIKMSVDAIVDNAIDYEEVSDALSVIYKEVFKDFAAELKTYPINTDPGSQIFIENMFSQMPTIGNAIGLQKASTAQILSGGTDEPIEDVPQTDPKQLLNEIENPTPTVAKPDFVLPKSKPSTADILRGIAPSGNSAASATASPATSTGMPASSSATIAPSFADGLDLDTNTDEIIDPFKNKSAAIAEIMGTKLTDMTGSAPKESYKIMPLSETMKSAAASAGNPSATPQANAAKARPVDPYREPIE